MLTTILLVAAFVLLVLAALNIPEQPRWSLGWMGLAFWVLAELLHGYLK